jgi:hypothetical protein
VAPVKADLGTVGHRVDEESRLQALAALRLLDTPREERFDRIVRLAQRIFGVETALVTLVDEDRQFHKAEVGFGRREIPRSQSFCSHAIAAGTEPFVVLDATEDERFRDNPLVTGPERVRFYAGQPLTTARGVAVGALCILDSAPRSISADDLDLLRELAGLAEAELALTDEIDRAGEVQRRLLPQSVPDLRGYSVAGGCLPANVVGGDFYDWFPAKGGYQFVLADVMGKGLGAAILGAGVRSAMRGTSQFNDLLVSVQRTAAGVAADLEETASFVTMFTARLDPAGHELAYVDAGHGIAGVVTAGGEAVQFESRGVPLGVSVDDAWALGSVPLRPGDSFICLSDGLLDLFGSIEEAREATRETVTACSGPDEVVQVVLDYARDHLATDDATVVVVRRDSL